jgi:hypothetical protein
MQGCEGSTSVMIIWQLSIVPMSDLANANCTSEQYGNLTNPNKVYFGVQCSTLGIDSKHSKS